MAPKKLSAAQMRSMVFASLAAKRPPAKSRAALMKRLDKIVNNTPLTKPQEKAISAFGKAHIKVVDSKPKLLPCPFCKDGSVYLEPGVTYASVRCAGCGSQGARLFYSTREGDKERVTKAVVKLWNQALR